MSRGLAALGALVALAGCGASEANRTTEQTPAAAPSALRPFQLGLTEQNPALIAPGEAPAGFAPWRDAVAALKPDHYRILVDWAALQPDPNMPADLAGGRDGCAREGVGPCAPSAGLRAQFEAAKAARAAAGGGWEIVPVILGAPDWAARPPAGCERPGAKARARPFSDAGLQGYRQLLGDLVTLGRDVGVALNNWSPYNEPNHPAFLSPQRAACDPDSPTLGPETYAAIVRAAREVLEPTGARLVLGELAGFERPTRLATGVGEFIRALPEDVACAAAVWSQHEYAIGGEPQPFRRDAVAEAEAALSERPCTAGLPLWITETGVGGARPGARRPTSARALAAQCAGQAARLERWAADPKVEAVFQYSVREDAAYPVALFDQTLTARYPTYDLWRSWADARGSAPARPAGCG